MQIGEIEESGIRLHYFTGYSNGKIKERLRVKTLHLLLTSTAEAGSFLLSHAILIAVIFTWEECSEYPGGGSFENPIWRISSPVSVDTVF